RPHLMADDDAEVPEGRQEMMDELFLRATDTAAEQQQQIDVRMQTQMSPAVPDERDDRERSVIRPGVGMQLADQRVDAIGVALQRAAAARAVRDRRAELSACS